MANNRRSGGCGERLGLQGVKSATLCSSWTSHSEDMTIEFQKQPKAPLLQDCTLPSQRRLICKATCCQPLVLKQILPPCAMLVEAFQGFLDIPQVHP